MARASKIGDTVPLAVVGRQDAREQPAEADKTAEGNDVLASLADLRGQVQALKEALASAQSTARSTVSTAASYASSNARSAVRTYPLSAIVLGALAGVIIGRMTGARATSVMRHVGMAVRESGALDDLRHSLADLAHELPGQIKASLRSALR